MSWNLGAPAESWVLGIGVASLVLVVLLATLVLGRSRRRELQRIADEQRLAEERLRNELTGVAARLEGLLRELAGASDTAARTTALDLVGRIEQSRALLGETLTSRFHELQAAQAQALGEGRREQTAALGALQEQVARELHRLRQDSEAKLEKIRATVEERLQQTLETRLGESFRLVSERLEQVQRGLGEMQSLAQGVGDLKRVLTNVKARGTFGEVQLQALLEQVLAPSQYARNVATVPGSRERVEFAVVLPGRDGDGSTVLLPVDAKFPQEDYLRLQDAYQTAATDAVAAARKALRTRLLTEAQAIRRKYLAPPDTTDFALLFVPTEGLYAEALRLDGLVERLQRDCQVVLVGPTTLFAVLNSLQMGFRTLAIEQRSSEVWKVLGAVKTEFGKFAGALHEVRRKLGEASAKIELSERRTRAMERKLRVVEALPEDAAGRLLDTDGNHRHEEQT